MDILRDSQLVIFSHSTTFITFFFKSFAGLLFKFLQSSRRQKSEVALDFCVWPLCGQQRPTNRNRPHFTEDRSQKLSSQVAAKVCQTDKFINKLEAGLWDWYEIFFVRDDLPHLREVVVLFFMKRGLLRGHEPWFSIIDTRVAKKELLFWRELWLKKDERV